MLHEQNNSFKRLAHLNKIKTIPTNSDMNLVPVILNTQEIKISGQIFYLPPRPKAQVTVYFYLGFSTNAQVI